MGLMLTSSFDDDYVVSDNISRGSTTLQQTNTKSKREMKFKHSSLQGQFRMEMAVKAINLYKRNSGL